MATRLDTNMRAVLTENVAVGVASSQSSVATTTGDSPSCVICVAVTQNTWVDFVVSPATATASEYWPAGRVEYREIAPKAQIAFIRDTTDGRITITRMA